MTPKKIYDIDPSIRKRVIETYPVTRKEKKCAIEAAKREYMRAELAKRIYNSKEELNTNYTTK